MHIEYPSSISISELVRKLKGRTSRKLQQENRALSNRYWGRHFWAIGYGVWSTGNLTDEMVQKYLSHHESSSNDTSNFVMED